MSIKSPNKGPDKREKIGRSPLRKTFDNLVTGFGFAGALSACTPDFDEGIKNNGVEYKTSINALEAPSDTDQTLDVGNGVKLRTGLAEAIANTDTRTLGYSLIKEGGNNHLVLTKSVLSDLYEYERTCAENDFESCLIGPEVAVNGPMSVKGGISEMVQDSNGNIFQVDSNGDYWLQALSANYNNGILTLVDNGTQCQTSILDLPLDRVSKDLKGNLIYPSGSGTVFKLNASVKDNCVLEDTTIPAENGLYTEIAPGVYSGGVKSVQNSKIYLGILKFPTSPTPPTDPRIGFKGTDVDLVNAGGYLLKDLNGLFIEMKDPKFHMDYYPDGRVKAAWIIGYREGVGPVSVKLSNFINNGQCDDGETFEAGEPACTPVVVEPDVLEDQDVSDLYTEVNDTTTNEVDGTEINQFDGTDAQIDAEVDTAIKEICTGDGDGICEDREYQQTCHTDCNIPQDELIFDNTCEGFQDRIKLVSLRFNDAECQANECNGNDVKISGECTVDIIGHRYIDEITGKEVVVHPLRLTVQGDLDGENGSFKFTFPEIDGETQAIGEKLIGTSRIQQFKHLKDGSSQIDMQDNLTKPTPNGNKVSLVSGLVGTDVKRSSKKNISTGTGLEVEEVLTGRVLVSLQLESQDGTKSILGSATLRDGDKIKWSLDGSVLPDGFEGINPWEETPVEETSGTDVGSDIKNDLGTDTGVPPTNKKPDGCSLSIEQSSQNPINYPIYLSIMATITAMVRRRKKS